MSTLVSIVYKPKDAALAEEDYTRLPLTQAQLIADYGIEGDSKGGSPGRHLNVMSVETLEGLAQEGFETAPGKMGEQLILSGIELDTLPAGTRLQIGEAACVELTEPRTGCGKFEKHQGKQRQEAAGRMGMMARVVTGGVISVGDPVQVVDGVSSAT